MLVFVLIYEHVLLVLILKIHANTKSNQSHMIIPSHLVMRGEEGSMSWLRLMFQDTLSHGNLTSSLSTFIFSQFSHLTLVIVTKTISFITK